MQHRARPPLDHREAAARFRLLADIEPLPNVRQHFRRLAAEHDEATAELGSEGHPSHSSRSGNAQRSRATPKRRWLVLCGGAIPARR
jgi:hypothetical protein